MTAGRRRPRAQRPVSSPVATDGPLAWLRCRKDRDGSPMIGEMEYLAGERLRRDLGRAAVVPGVSMDWGALLVGPSQGGRGPSPAEGVTDARDRAVRALDAVGPELGAILVDTCGAERALPEIERARGWPARSGKVVLRLALSALARHYGLAHSASGRPGPTRHWGSADYKPKA